MDPQLKERLVGAAVLVALAVWLIPWLLDGRDDARPEAGPDAGTALELPVPDDAAPRRTETVELGRDASRRSAGNGPSDPDPRAEEQAVAIVVPPAPVDDADAAEAPAAEPQLRNEPTADERSDEWLVQLGSFSEENNAARLAERIRPFGYSAFVSAHRAGGQTMHRVRVGGFATRNEAEAAIASLSAHGFVAQVVVPE